ncbi:MAG TPA: hypothetical protein VEW03_05950 [Longimicrobiaceae bacterium]|nr:hypothetical protein [Longimicrobiaceae bacterium]
MDASSFIVAVVKELAGPAAGVFGIYIAARQAIKGFRAQKLLERRLDWYDRMIKEVGGAQVAVEVAGLEGSPEAGGNARWRLAAARDTGWQSNLYASPSGHREVEAWRERVRQVAYHHPPVMGQPESESVSAACTHLVKVLAAEMRRDLGAVDEVVVSARD